MIMSSPRVMRELPRLLPKAGLRLIATQAHVYAEAGSSSFLLNLAETYAPLAASTGLLPAARRRRVARRPAPLRRGRHVLRRLQLLRLHRTTLTPRLAAPLPARAKGAEHRPLRATWPGGISSPHT